MEILIQTFWSENYQACVSHPCINEILDLEIVSVWYEGTKDVIGLYSSKPFVFAWERVIKIDATDLNSFVSLVRYMATMTPSLDQRKLFRQMYKDTEGMQRNYVKEVGLTLKQAWKKLEAAETLANEIELIKDHREFRHTHDPGDSYNPGRDCPLWNPVALVIAKDKRFLRFIVREWRHQ